MARFPTSTPLIWASPCLYLDNFIVDSPSLLGLGEHRHRLLSGIDSGDDYAGQEDFGGATAFGFKCK